MTKAISAVIATIMLLLITISLVGVFYAFSATIAGSGTSSAGEQVSRTSASMLGLMRIDNTNGYTVEVRNIGTVDLSDIMIFADNVPVNISKMEVDGIQTDKIPKGKSGIITVNGSYLPIKRNPDLMVSSGGAQILQVNWKYPIVAVVQDSSCSCGWTVSSCSSWWQNRLKEKGIAVVNISTSDIDTLAKMQQYDAILNPYGEYYPETSCTPNPSAPGGYDCTILDSIRSYVAAGGYWFESGGFSFYYSCGAIPNLNANGDNHVCTNIDGTISTPRDKDAAYSYMAPNGPALITGTSRPSVGVLTAGYGECAGAEFKGLYRNATTNRYGPAMHCFGKGCVVRTDDTNPDVVAVYADIINTQVNPR
ncbi:MAG: hypothetical protein WA139_00945 [Candidatus Aenigmatarchaeota archaeon]